LRYEKIPILGDLLRDLFRPEDRKYRRYKEREDRSRRLKAQIYSLLTVLSGVVYLVWVFRSLDLSHPVAGGLFVFAEGMALLLFLVTATNGWTLRYKRPEGLEVEHPYDVDVFVTVCGEPLPVVRRTLEATADIRGVGSVTRYVLDDGGSDEVRAVAEELGFEYLSRARRDLPQKNAKAGNLNFGLRHSDGTLILVLDADQVPEPDILEVLAGYMRFPEVAFVQTRQSYLVPEGDPFFNQDSGFYEAVQLGFDADDTVISCGSGVLYRRAALADIGGFVEWNLVEDLTTSYNLHSNGWKSFYYPYDKTTGLAPDTIQDFYQQRSQWALDTMRLFFWDNPLIKDNISLKKAKYFVLVATSYISSGFALPIFFLIPVWTYLTGNTFIEESAFGWHAGMEFFVIRGAYFVFMSLAMHYLLRGRSVNRQFRSIVGLFPVYARETIRALFYPPGRKPSYSTNNTSRAEDRWWSAAWTVAPQLLVFGANALLPFYAAWNDVASTRILAVNAMVSLFALWSIWPILRAAFGGVEWDEEKKPENFYDIERSAAELSPAES
jgi:cellulose synthase (UDP-forming)